MTMGPVAKAYAALVAAGELKPDLDQKNAVKALDRLGPELTHNKPRLFERFLGRRAAAPRGVYLWGGVGRGKSMLMDLAFDQIAAEPKRRTHFAPFMLDVHQRLRKARKTEEGDPVIAVAEALAAE